LKEDEEDETLKRHSGTETRGPHSKTRRPYFLTYYW